MTQIEEAFKNLKGDLVLRPIYHQKPERIEAHIFVSFLAYCLHVSLLFEPANLLVNAAQKLLASAGAQRRHLR